MIGTTTGYRLVAAFAVALLLGLGAADQAGAERVPTGGDTTQRACKALQDDALATRALINQDTSPEVYAEAMAKLKRLANDWDRLGCDAAWGNMFIYRVMPTESLVARPDGGIEVVDEPVPTPPTADEAVGPIGGVEGVEPKPVAEPATTSLSVPAGEAGVVTTLPVPGTTIPVPEGDGGGEVSIQPVPEPAGTLIEVPSGDGGGEVSIQPVPPAESTIIPEPAGDGGGDVTILPVAAEDAQP